MEGTQEKDEKRSNTSLLGAQRRGNLLMLFFLWPFLCSLCYSV